MRLHRFQNKILKVMGVILILLLYNFARAEVVLVDSLANSTKGEQNGGRLTADGWVPMDGYDFIRYDLGESISSGKISFDITGLTMERDIWNWEQDHFWHTVLGQWDAEFTKYGQEAKFNPYKCQLWIARNEDDPFKSGHVVLRLNVNATTTGYDDDPNAFEVMSEQKWEWDPTVTYHFELEWGAGLMTWYINGDKAVAIDYSSTGQEYAPNHHVFQIGHGTDNEPSNFRWLCTPINVVFSNVQVESYHDYDPPIVEDYQPDDNEFDVDIGSDIAIWFNESMDQASVENAFSITPEVSGEMIWSGKAFYFNPDALLEVNTTYTVTISEQATDYNGNNLTEPLSFSFSTRPYVYPQTVERYGVFDIPLVNGSMLGNKYTDVWVRGDFYGPTEHITIDGFWDGGDIWRVRMSPTEVGNWTFNITASNPALNTSGSFYCSESSNKGFLQKNPERPYTFMYSDGTPFFWKGETSWRGYTSVVGFESRFKPYIDLRSSQGFTAVQSILVSYINGLGFWKNEGGLIFDESSDAKNYDLLNPQYFHWVDKRIDYMLSKGVIPVIFFTWAQEFIEFSDSQFERFARYIVSRYAAQNVVWVICGEYDEGYTDYGLSADVYEHLGEYVYGLDPYNHPITYHPTGRSSCREFGDREWLGLVMQQSPYWHRDAIRDRVFNKPVVNGEYGYAGWNEDDDVLHGAWDIISGGAFFTAGFFTTFAPDKGGWDLEGNAEQAEWLGFLFNLFEQCEWNKMDPNDDLVSSGHCMAQVGREYVIYLPDGGSVTVDLSAASGEQPVEWLNPRTGIYFDADPVTGGASQSITAPFTGEAVAHIGQWADRDTTRPNPPQNLTSPEQTEHTIALS